MNESMFQINAENVNTESIVDQIRSTVIKKMETGHFANAIVARAERTNLVNLQNDEAFMEFYINCLRDSVFVDINDFEIIERRTAIQKPVVFLKKTIWKLLKFYTYRLWSQQNQVNGLLLSAMENIESRFKDKIADLEKKVSELEKQGKSN